ENDPECKIVFMGPCTAKKAEFQKETGAPYIDSVITFEELQALFDGKNLDLGELEEGVLDNASYYGRIFARSGGLCDAVAEALNEQGADDFELKGIACNGIEECKVALLKASKNVLPNNFIEGMACSGGCIGGAGCLTHEERDKNEVDKYGKEAFEKTIKDAIAIYYRD
ncbi:MAG: ferredoxin, partial [Ruminiclostridium sp.]|nr:ferredoxin [Ruminiclostridium sp.]